MNLFVEDIKYKNSKLLFFFFLVLQIAFSLVLKELYIFRKVEVHVGLVFEFSKAKFLISLSMILIVLLTVTVNRVRGFFYLIQILTLIFLVFPSAIMFANIRSVDYRIFLSHLLFFFSLVLIGKIKLNTYPESFETNKIIKLLFYFILIGIIPFVILYLPHINLKNLFFQEIYETRALLAEKVNNIYTNYTYSWFNKILIPILFVFGLYSRNKLIIVASVLILVFLFLCGAHKAVFVGIIIIVILYKYNYETKAKYFIKFMLLITIISLVASLVFNNDILMIMSIRRALFIPALLDVLYFDFFEGNYLYWSETFNGLIADYPYEYSHSYVIGKHYFNDIDWGANNGLISDGFMNFGMFGVIINILIVGVYFSLINQLNVSSKFFGVFFLLFFVIISSSLSTVLLTHGGILLLLLAFIVLKDTDKKMM